MDAPQCLPPSHRAVPMRQTPSSMANAMFGPRGLPKAVQDVETSSSSANSIISDSIVADSIIADSSSDSDSTTEPSICEVKRLYDLKKKEGSEWPFQADHGKHGAAAKDYVVVHRLETKSIHVQSHRLRRLLDQVFADYPDWNPDATPYVFSPPFKPFCHRWNKIMTFLSQQEEKTAKEAELLCQELESILMPYLDAMERMKTTGVVTFHALWLVFSPGDFILTRENGNMCVSRLRNMKLRAPRNGDLYWDVHLERIDWNGSYCGFVDHSLRISSFSEPRSVIKLNACPLEFVKDNKAIWERLLTRGRKFAALRGYHVKTCEGKKYVSGARFQSVKAISGRVIVDAFAYYRCQELAAPDLARNPEGEAHAEKTIGPGKDSNDQSAAKGMRKEELRPLTDIECVMAVPRVRGFDLKTKEWCEFNVDEIQGVDWSTTAYDKLVLPEGEKELLMAFINQRKKRQFDDFVQHKGEGIIILLCGPPGVGKTLTAEAVAEKSEIPLYVLSAGELGSSPEKVESALDNALECCRLWNSVLLLDEADVFLETRKADSLDRNELVSIFLRRLEYYQGLMFMTTNRIGAIDDAFKSRIDLILPYYNLDAQARRRVWVNFVSMLAPGTADLSDGDFDELAKVDVNGREVKNLIKTAQVLAAEEGPLAMKHLQVVLNIRKRYYDAHSC